MKLLESSALYKAFNFAPFLPDRFLSNKLEIIALADLDDTLIPWTKFRKSVNKKFLSDNQSAFKEAYGRTLIGAVTGLDFRSVKEIKDLLNGFPPFDFLSTDNGMVFYSNNDNQCSSFGQWVAKTEPEDFDKEWEDFIKGNTGWDRKQFFSILTDKLGEDGFKKLLPREKTPDLAYPHCKVYKRADLFNSFAVFSEGESAIYMLMNPKVNLDLRENEARSFAEAVRERYKSESKKEIKFNISDHGNYLYIFFSPVGNIQISKASVFPLIVNKLPKNKLKEVKAAVGFGDSKNDDHLKVKEVRLPLEKPFSIPVYSIHSGDSLKNDKEYSEHPRIFYAQQGNIGRTFINVMRMVDGNA